MTNNSGGLYCIRKELMEQLLRDGHEIYAVTPFDEFVDEMCAMGVHLIKQDLNRRGTNPFQEMQLLAQRLRFYFVHYMKVFYAVGLKLIRVYHGQ